MKYVLLLLGVALIYYFLVRSAPVVPVAQAVTAQEVAPLTGSREAAAPAATALKRPLDRTHAVLDQAKQRNGGGEF
jgi:ABC-type microcin C transport system permease subunit YejB